MLNQGKISEEPSQLIDQDETSAASNHNNKPDESEGNILDFEFCMVYSDIQGHLAPLHSRIGSNGKVWFSGKIDKNTEKIISSGFGRIGQQQEGW